MKNFLVILFVVGTLYAQYGDNYYSQIQTIRAQGLQLQEEANELTASYNRKMSDLQSQMAQLEARERQLIEWQQQKENLENLFNR